MQLTPADITMDWLKSITVDQFRSVLQQAKSQQDPTLLALNTLLTDKEAKRLVNEMLNDPDYVPVAKRPLTEEEQAAIADDQARADQQAQEAEANAAVAAQQEQDSAYSVQLAQNRANEDAQAAQIGMVLIRNAYGDIEKIIHDYQARDEDGNPIGNPTHFESTNLIVHCGKLQNAHINAGRYAERMRGDKHKVASATMTAGIKSEKAEAAAARSRALAEEAAKEQDGAKMQEAVKASIEAEKESQEALRAAQETGRAITNSWLADHTEDFLPCQASSKIMGDYMTANGLSWTYDNLEKTFQAVKDQLPKPVRSVATTPVSEATNTPAEATMTEAEASAQSAVAPANVAVRVSAAQANPQAVPPASAATAPTANVAVNRPVVTRKPVVNGGLQPGTLSAPRPESTATTPEDIAATRSRLLKEIRNMPNEVYRKKIANDTKYVAQLKAAGIPVIGK